MEGITTTTCSLPFLMSALSGNRPQLVSISTPSSAAEKMLSSRGKGIFRVGEEGVETPPIRINHHHARRILTHRTKGTVPAHVRSPVEGHVGLRIVIQQQQHVHGSNIVLKPMVNPCKFKELLKACHLCKKVLSPNMDVYMYRGDIGFCSEECRYQQILTDEQTEAASKRKRLNMTRHHGHHQQQPSKSNIKPAYHPKKILLMA